MNGQRQGCAFATAPARGPLAREAPPAFMELHRLPSPVISISFLTTTTRDCAHREGEGIEPAPSGGGEPEVGTEEVVLEQERKNPVTRTARRAVDPTPRVPPSHTVGGRESQVLDRPEATDPRNAVLLLPKPDAIAHVPGLGANPSCAAACTVSES